MSKMVPFAGPSVISIVRTSFGVASVAFAAAAARLRGGMTDYRSRAQRLSRGRSERVDLRGARDGRGRQRDGDDDDDDDDDDDSRARRRAGGRATADATDVSERSRAARTFSRESGGCRGDETRARDARDGRRRAPARTTRGYRAAAARRGARDATADDARDRFGRERRVDGAAPRASRGSECRR